MKIINMGRGQGKTTKLIQYSSENKIPILCLNYQQCKMIEEKAKEMNLVIPPPISVGFLKLGLLAGKGIDYERVVIDELELVLSAIIESDVDLVTTSCEMEITRGDKYGI